MIEIQIGAKFIVCIYIYVLYRYIYIYYIYILNIVSTYYIYIGPSTYRHNAFAVQEPKFRSLSAKSSKLQELLEPPGGALELLAPPWWGPRGVGLATNIGSYEHD